MFIILVAILNILYIDITDASKSNPAINETPNDQLASSDSASMPKKRRGRPSKTETLNKSLQEDNSKTTKTNYKEKFHEFDKKISSYMSLVCDICNVQEENFMQLTNHMKLQHNVEGYVVCCSKKFNKRSRLVEHIDMHLNPEMYK